MFNKPLSMLAGAKKRSTILFKKLYEWEEYLFIKALPEISNAAMTAETKDETTTPVKSVIVSVINAVATAAPATPILGNGPIPKIRSGSKIILIIAPVP